MFDCLKNEHVLYCGNLSQLSANFLAQNRIKSITIATSDDQQQPEIKQQQPQQENVRHIITDVTKIADLEDLYKSMLSVTKRIDCVINSKEMFFDEETWEAQITKHINSMICSTLMAMKYTGRMNMGEGCMVVNVLTIYSESEAAPSRLFEINRLMCDLDRCFSDPYYLASTGVRILTMCTCINNNSTTPPNQWLDDLMHVLMERRSLLLKNDDDDSIKEFEIFIEK